MNRRNTILLALALLLIGWILHRNSGRDAEREAARLLEKADNARVLDNDHDVSRPTDESGDQNPPLPGDFIVDFESNGNWFVGKRGTEHGMLLPYRPREIPKPAEGLAPVGQNPGFLGAQACQQCHHDRHAGFIHTAHHRTSAVATTESIAGSFEPGKNAMKTKVQSVSFEMIQRDGRPFQRVSFFGWKCDVPFDLVTGSSKLGQTYLYWHDDALFQMSVSYVTNVDDWTNSPGFADGDAIYARPVTTRCLECHSTWADVRRPPNHFTPESLILGISCERCHGPGQQHVTFHQDHPAEKSPRFITHPGTLPRERQLDICGQCHFGNPRLKGAPYQFRPGDQLTDYYFPPKEELAGGVHSSNQLMRLSKSPCFTKTEMTCTDCHNPHQSERGNRKLFSQRCLKCHEPVDCGMEPTLGAQLSDNCIDCHMPASASENMFMDTAEGKVFPPLRDHHIRVDQKLTDAYLKTLNR